MNSSRALGDTMFRKIVGPSCIKHMSMFVLFFIISDAKWNISKPCLFIAEAALKSPIRRLAWGSTWMFLYFE